MLVKRKNFVVCIKMFGVRCIQVGGIVDRVDG